MSAFADARAQRETVRKRIRACRKARARMLLTASRVHAARNELRDAREELRSLFCRDPETLRASQIDHRIATLENKRDLFTEAVQKNADAFHAHARYLADLRCALRVLRRLRSSSRMATLQEGIDFADRFLPAEPPACGHSACRQYWIETGENACIREEDPR